MRHASVRLWAWAGPAIFALGSALGGDAGRLPVPVVRVDDPPTNTNRPPRRDPPARTQTPAAQTNYKKAQDKAAEAEYKQKMAENMESIKEMFRTAEDLYKEQRYREAASFYQSVAMATNPKAQKEVDTSRSRLLEMEELAQQHLKAADDADLAREYLKEVEELTIVVKDFPFTKACATALNRLVALKSRREVAAHVDYAEAEAAEAAGNLAQALKLYKKLAENPRFENSVPALKARRKVDSLQKDEATREALKTQLMAEADKEAPVILNAGRNFLLNNRPAEAKEKFRAVIEKFPDTTYAEQARQELEKLP
jgi:hypothetical protein